MTSFCREIEVRMSALCLRHSDGFAHSPPPPPPPPIKLQATQQTGRPKSTENKLQKEYSLT